MNTVFSIFLGEIQKNLGYNPPSNEEEKISFEESEKESLNLSDEVEKKFVKKYKTKPLDNNFYLYYFTTPKYLKTPLRKYFKLLREKRQFQSDENDLRITASNFQRSSVILPSHFSNKIQRMSLRSDEAKNTADNKSTKYIKKIILNDLNENDESKNDIDSLFEDKSLNFSETDDKNDSSVCINNYINNNININVINNNSGNPEVKINIESIHFLDNIKNRKRNKTFTDKVRKFKPLRKAHSKPDNNYLKTKKTSNADSNSNDKNNDNKINTNIKNNNETDTNKKNFDKKTSIELIEEDDFYSDVEDGDNNPEEEVNYKKHNLNFSLTKNNSFYRALNAILGIDDHQSNSNSNSHNIIKKNSSLQKRRQPKKVKFVDYNEVYKFGSNNSSFSKRKRSDVAFSYIVPLRKSEKNEGRMEDKK